MAVEKINRFRASDGKEFSDFEDAERHEIKLSKNFTELQVEQRFVRELCYYGPEYGNLVMDLVCLLSSYHKFFEEKQKKEGAEEL
uniref:Uncharacterized protein n=1 Tax=viral metagenome TaxID=1070528 RepID=A0A6H1ZV45_9ZZZZ